MQQRWAHLQEWLYDPPWPTCSAIFPGNRNLVHWPLADSRFDYYSHLLCIGGQLLLRSNWLARICSVLDTCHDPGDHPVQKIDTASCSFSAATQEEMGIRRAVPWVLESPDTAGHLGHVGDIRRLV